MMTRWLSSVMTGLVTHPLEHRMMIHKIEAQGDTVYVEAESEDDAIATLNEKVGPIPRSLLTVSVVDVLPDGEELL